MSRGLTDGEVGLYEEDALQSIEVNDELTFEQYVSGYRPSVDQAKLRQAWDNATERYYAGEHSERWRRACGE